MARICPLCGEEVRDIGKYPHICENIPMEIIGQCQECGTGLTDLNISPLYENLCLECHRKLPGNKSEAVGILKEKGAVLFVHIKGAWYIWVYATVDKWRADVMRRTWGGNVCLHSTNRYKWTCTRRNSVLVLAKDLKDLNPELGEDILAYCREVVPSIRYDMVRAYIEKYKGKSVRVGAV
jgi:hypothetical protein